MALDWNRPSLSVFFGNLDPRVTESMLYNLGVQAGPVARVKLNGDGKKKSFAFVEFEHLDSAVYCIGLFHKLLNLFGSAVSVAFSKNEYPAADVTEEEKQLIERVKRLQNCTGEQGGGGVLRRPQHGAPRFAPYTHSSGSRGDQRQRDARDLQKDRDLYRSHDREHQVASDTDALPYQQHGWTFGGSQQENSTAHQSLEPVPGWQERAAAAAAEAAAAAGLLPAAQPVYHAQPQPPPPRPMQTQQQQLQQQQAHFQCSQQVNAATPVAAHVAAAAGGGNFSSSGWNLTAPQQQQQVAAAAPTLQYQPAVQSHALQYQLQPQQYQQQYQQPQQLQVQYQQQQYQQPQPQAQYNYHQQQQQQQHMYVQGGGTAGTQYAGWQQQPQQQAVYTQPTGQVPPGAAAAPVYYVQY